MLVRAPHHILQNLFNSARRQTAQQLNSDEEMASIKGVTMVITLIAVYVLATHTSAAHHGCCLSYMKSRIPFKIITGYSVQTVTETCPINAIIFHTEMGKACSNPALKWVIAYVERLSKKAANIHNAAQKHKQRPSPF